MKDFSGKVVVITGGASGIGLSFAGRFGRDGAKVVLADVNQEGLEKAEKSLREAGIEAAGFVCDVAVRAEVENLLGFACEKFGTADVILNGAGVGSARHRVVKFAREEIDRVMATNFYGVWHGVCVFGEFFMARGEPAAIYNIGSENSFFNFVPRNFAYQVSKHGVLVMSDALRREMPDFIDVSLICPGWVLTGMTKANPNGMAADDFTAIAMKQLKAGEFFVVSHAHNIVHIKKLHQEIESAYAKYAPRYEGDEEYDVPTLLAKLAKGEQQKNK